MSQLYEYPVSLEQYNVSGKTYELPGKVMYVTEQFVPSLQWVPEWSNYVFVVSFIIGFALLSAFYIDLSSYQYYICSGLAMLAIVSFDIDGLMHTTQSIYTGVALAMYILVSFGLFWFKNKVRFTIRFLWFLIWFGIIVAFIFYKSPEPKPLVLFAAQIIPTAFVLFCLLSFLVGYQAIYLILKISTQVKQQNGLPNFLIGTSIFIVNILLIYLNNTKVIDWNILYISPFVFLLLAVCIGLTHVESSFGRLSAYLHLKWAVIGLCFVAFGLLSFGFIAANDPLIEACEDAVLYSQIGFGLLFLLYVVLNFGTMFRQQLAIWQVVFKPMIFPFYYFKIGAIALIVTLLAVNEYFPLFQMASAYYSAKGDHAMATNQYPLAEAYYKNGIAYERQNHKVNYAMASLAALQGDNITAGTYYRLAVQKKASPQAFVALSQSLKDEDLFFEAIFALKDGFKQFPQSGEIANNLALLFEKSKAYDSTRIYLKKAYDLCDKNQIPKANTIAFSLKNGFLNEQQDWAKTTDGETYNALVANSIALNIVKNSMKLPKLEQAAISKDSVLNTADLAYWNNLTILTNKQGKAIELPIKQWTAQEGNFSYAGDLAWLNIQNQFFGQDKSRALELLQQKMLVDTSRFTNLWYNTALLKMENEAPNSSESNLKTVEDALNLYQKYPLHVGGLQKIQAYLNAQKQDRKAYDLLLKSKLLAPKNTEILKLYIVQCLKINMNDYAKDGIAELVNLAPDEARFVKSLDIKEEKFE